MGLTTWASGLCVAGADNLQHIDNMCFMSAVEDHPTLLDNLVELVREHIMENRRVTIMELISHFPQISYSLLHKIVTPGE